jgi:sialate O-acetylesterase
LHGHGYACALPAMIASWRALWSATPETTDPLFPWAIAQLHDGTDLGEGFPFMLSKFRYAQTAGFGSLPNEAMPNVFGISMVDAGDPC